MDNSPLPSQRPQPPAAPGPAAWHRSGAVARMLGMPVATLRVWERRYQLTQAALSPSGQRRYSADDVQRLALIKQLTEWGHAISSLAALDLSQLQQVAATHVQTQAATQAWAVAPADALALQADGAGGLLPAPWAAAGPAPVQTWRVAAVGAAWGKRLQRPALLQSLGPGVQLLGPYENLAQATAALQDQPPDAVLWHQPHLHDGWWAEVQAAAPAWAAWPQAVLYGFAADPVCEALAAAGVALLREPQPDVVLAHWLRSLRPRSPLLQPGTAFLSAPGAAPAAVPQRRWSDAVLADFASRSSTIACECPRHVAELLVQLTQFEAYSASCESRQAADADLHAYLRQVAAVARAQFEAALEQVARHEGLPLPATVSALQARVQPQR